MKKLFFIVLFLALPFSVFAESGGRWDISKGSQAISITLYSDTTHNIKNCYEYRKEGDDEYVAIFKGGDYPGAVAFLRKQGLIFDVHDLWDVAGFAPTKIPAGTVIKLPRGEELKKLRANRAKNIKKAQNDFADFWARHKASQQELLSGQKEMIVGQTVLTEVLKNNTEATGKVLEAVGVMNKNNISADNNVAAKLDEIIKLLKSGNVAVAKTAVLTPPAEEEKAVVAPIASTLPATPAPSEVTANSGSSLIDAVYSSNQIEAPRRLSRSFSAPAAPTGVNTTKQSTSLVDSVYSGAPVVSADKSSTVVPAIRQVGVYRDEKTGQYINTFK